MTTTPALPLLDELDELRAKATPGPWEVRWQCPEESHHHDWDEGWIADPAGATVAVLQERYTSAPADAACIVAEHNAVPKVTAALRAVAGLEPALRTLAAVTVDSDYDRGVAAGYRVVADNIRDVLRAALASPAPGCTCDRVDQPATYHFQGCPAVYPPLASPTPAPQDANGCPDQPHHGVDCPGDACRYASAPQGEEGQR